MRLSAVVLLALCCAWINCDVVTAVDPVQDNEQQALLDSSKKLPDTQEEKDKAYTTQALPQSPLSCNLNSTHAYAVCHCALLFGMSCFW